MPWWSWVLIWAAMGALLVGTLALLGFMLFRKAMRTFDAVDELGRLVSAAQASADADAPGSPQPSFVPAVFQDPALLRLVMDLKSHDRRHRKQVRRDRLIAHGKLFSHAQMIQRTRPHAR